MAKKIRLKVNRAWVLRSKAVDAGYEEDSVTEFVVDSLKAQSQPKSISRLARSLGVAPGAIHYHLKKAGVVVESETIVTINGVG